MPSAWRVVGVDLVDRRPAACPARSPDDLHRRSSSCRAGGGRCSGRRLHAGHGAHALRATSRKNAIAALAGPDSAARRAERAWSAGDRDGMPRSTSCSARSVRIIRLGADQQHQRERDFDDHQAVAQQRLARAVPAGRGPPRAAALARSRVERVQRRGEPEDHARSAPTDATVKSSTGSVERDLRLVGDRVRAGRCAMIAAQAAERERARRARRRPRASSRLSVEQLADEARPRLAPERGAHRHLAVRRGGARQQQVRDVGAGDQQQQRRPRRTGSRAVSWMLLGKVSLKESSPTRQSAGKLRGFAASGGLR